MIVYLGGSITKDPKHLNWRGTMQEQLMLAGHRALSPMRGKDSTRLGEKGLTSDIDPMLFCERDRMDVERADVVISAYFAGLPRQSLGTWVEAGWAIWLHRPWIVYTDDPDVRFHPFVKKWAAAVVTAPDLAGLLRTVLWMD